MIEAGIGKVKSHDVSGKGVDLMDSAVVSRAVSRGIGRSEKGMGERRLVAGAS